MKQSLTGKFLLASHALQDPNFVRSAILIVRHDADGAFGFILNRPMPISVGQSLADAIDIAGEANQPVYFGGPCQGPVFVIHTDPNVGGESPMGGIFVTTDREAIEALLGAAAEPVKFFGSYSGWSALQLETELAEGSWQIVDAAESDVFSDSEQLWEKLNARANLARFIDPSRIPDDPSVN